MPELRCFSAANAAGANFVLLSEGNTLCQYGTAGSVYLAPADGNDDGGEKALFVQAECRAKGKGALLYCV